MSFNHTKTARALRLPATQKATLMALCDWCHEDGKDEHSVASMMQWTCLSKTAVLDALRGLEKAGLIRIERRFGTRSTTFVQLHAMLSRPENQCATNTGARGVPVRVADSTGAPGVQTGAPGVPKALEASEKNHSAAAAAGADAPSVDLKGRVFAEGNPLLIESGLADKKANSLLGSWLKAHAPEKVLDALTRCAAADPKPARPVAYITALLSGESRTRGKRPQPALLASNRPEDFYVPSA